MHLHRHPTHPTRLHQPPLHVPVGIPFPQLKNKGLATCSLAGVTEFTDDFSHVFIMGLNDALVGLEHAHGTDEINHFR